MFTKLFARFKPEPKVEETQGKTFTNAFGHPVCWAWRDEPELTQLLFVIQPASFYYH